MKTWRVVLMVILFAGIWQTPAAPGWAAAALELYGTFEAMGVIVNLDAGDDPDLDATAQVEYRQSGAGAYQQGFPLSRVSATRFVGSLFWLEASTAYDVRVSFSDPDGGPLNGANVTGSASTRSEINIPAASHEYIASPTGSGTACSLAAPCALTEAISQAQEGEAVVLRGGTYYEGEIDLPRSGSPGAPIVIRSYPGETAILDGADPTDFFWIASDGGFFVTTVNIPDTHLLIHEGQRLYPYQTFDDLLNQIWGMPGFYVDGTTVYAIFEGGTYPNADDIQISRYNHAFSVEQDYIYFTGLTFRHYGQGEYAKAIYFNNASDNLVQNCTFTHNDLGIGVKYASGRNVFENNTFSDTIFDWPWDGVKAGSGLETGGIRFYEPTSGRGNIIRRNTFHNYFDGFGACPGSTEGETNETDVYENLVYRAGDDGMETDGECSNVRIWDNTFHDVLAGISLAPVYTGPVYAIRNLIYNTGVGNNEYTGLAFKFNSGYDPSGPMFLFHNTADAALPGNNGLDIKSPGDWALITARNNIWAGTEYALYNANPTQPLDLDYDNLYTTLPGELAWWDDLDDRHLNTLAELQSATGQEMHGFNLPPGFNDPATGDYSLDSSSQMLDQGLYIPGINDDYNDSAPDLGAFEFIPSLFLNGMAGDQVIHLNWEVNITLPATTTWTITYTGPAGDQPSPITGILAETSAYTITGLTNYEWYTITLYTEPAFLSARIDLMPTDRQIPPACSDAAVRLTPDYAYALGSAYFSDPEGDAESGSRYRWLVDGSPITDTLVAEGILLHFDDSTTGANGEAPSATQGVAYAAGKWDNALALPTGGSLKYARPDNLPLDEGTVELWVAPRADGDDPIYTSKSHVLFFYKSAGDDYLLISQSDDSQIIYAGGTVNGEWQSAYGGKGFMGGWQAGEWHHLAFTYSQSGNYMRFYVDGVLTADTNEGHYWPPDADGAEFSIGGSPWWSNTADYWVDEVRISGHAASTAEIVARAARQEPARPNEIWLSTSFLTPGDTLAYEFTPAVNGEEGAACTSAPLEFPGIPVFNPQLPSTLLPVEATSFALTVESLAPTRCAYSVNTSLAYDLMTPFGEATDVLTHTATIQGLNPDANTLNDVYVRCASHPDYQMHLRYRSLSASNPDFPRTGNLWGWGEWYTNYNHSLEELSKVDLWLGAWASADQIRQLRLLNPDIRVLTSINAVENNDIPSDDYYLKDVNGDLIEVWPGSYRLNLTRFDVAEYQAQYAYQSWLDSGMMADGVFFDNVMTTQSWQLHDIYGNPVQIDANEDGIEDDPAWLDAAWKAGVFHEIETFRQLMPHAIVSGHSMNIYEPGIADLFDGISIGFQTANVLEGERTFSEVWDQYKTWMASARTVSSRPSPLPPFHGGRGENPENSLFGVAKLPQTGYFPVFLPPLSGEGRGGGAPVVMFESSPVDQIAYGYDYEPWEKIPASTLEFARTYYPHVRFGLALTLMDDGFFAHEYGDTWHGNDWWYDELDYDLGYPLGPAYRMDVGFDPGPNGIVNGSFESPIENPWRFWVNTGAGCQASFGRDAATAAVGQFSARVEITATSGTSWHVDFNQNNRSLVQGAVYDLSFWAKADRQRPLTLGASKNAPDWDNYGLYHEMTLSPTWQLYTVTFEATATASDTRIQFFTGEVTGTVWLDDVQLRLHPPDVFRRDYTNGSVLLNGTQAPQTVTLGPGYQRLVGSQAPLDEFILDDSDATFTTTTGTWSEQTYDSGEWQASGPFYHAWKMTLHESSTPSEARWNLPIQASGVYTITVWWPAAPAASGWASNARFEVVAGEQVVASATLDQRQGGDEWHLIAAIALDPTQQPYVRLVCSGAAPCVADALHIRSAARYNNGLPATTLTLAPLDGIVLARRSGQIIYLPLVQR